MCWEQARFSCWWQHLPRLVAALAKAGGSRQNIMLIMWEPLIMQELLISILQEPKSGHSWTSKVFNTVITLDTYQFFNFGKSMTSTRYSERNGC